MKIAVLRGGPSKHYETSLKTGELVLSHLRTEPQRYEPIDVFISREGDWHVRGRKRDPHEALRSVDLVWNALHGEYGEDGSLARLLSNMSVPHTGSTALGLSVSLNKDVAKQAYAREGLATPAHEVLQSSVSLEEILRIFRTYVHPVVVKPVSGRGGLGVRIVHGFEELKEAVANAFAHAERVMVEEFVRGTLASCAVLEDFRSERRYALIPTPASFTPETHRAIERMAKSAHEALGLRHYSLSDFIVMPSGKIYIIETNALPELSLESPFHRSLSGVGLDHKNFIEHVISIAK